MNTKLILNADDFGRSHSINEAVILAHREGVLTSASLMVNGEAFDEAVELARQNPSLGIGLHLTVACGQSTLPPNEIPDLVDEYGTFPDNAVSAGLKYFFKPGIRRQLVNEISAQFNRFQQTGLPLDHVNGHLNFHLHPTILEVLLKLRDEWSHGGFRIVRDNYRLGRRLSGNGSWYLLTHAVIFSALSAFAAPEVNRVTPRTTDRMFGLLQNDGISENYLLELLPQLGNESVEIYCHPDTKSHRHELDALLSPRVADTIKKLGITLCRYQDL